MSRRVLITGASGFVGTYLSHAFQEAGSEVVAANINRGASDSVDMCDAAAVDDCFKRNLPEIVIHLAAQSSVGALKDGEENTWRVNLGGTLNLALAVARFTPTAKVLFASSSEVYGLSFTDRAVDEKVEPRPVNSYAKSKRLAELILDDVLPRETRLIIARPFNHTGRGQREDFVLASFAAQIARIEGGLQRPAIKVGNLEAARDFLDVRDVVAAYMRLIEVAEDLPKRITCNIASGTAYRLRELLNSLVNEARVPVAIEIDPARLRPSDIPTACGNAALIRSLTGWSPSFAIETTLKSLLDAARIQHGVAR